MNRYIIDVDSNGNKYIRPAGNFDPVHLTWAEAVDRYIYAGGSSEKVMQWAKKFGEFEAKEL